LQRRRLHKTKDTIWEGAPKTSQQIAEKASQAKGTVLEGSLGNRHCSWRASKIHPECCR